MTKDFDEQLANQTFNPFDDLFAGSSFYEGYIHTHIQTVQQIYIGPYVAFLLSQTFDDS